MPDRAMLFRQRLLDRLRARWFAPVTVLAAPAGYGKTTLLSQAIAANVVTPMGIDCWLACGPELAVASRLGEALCRAVGVPSPPAVRASRADTAAAVAHAVREAMWRRSPQQVALVLDDVHELVPDSDGARLLAAVVAALPANGHIVLAGRSPLDLEPLTRLDLEGRVVRFDQTDLAFTEGEVAAFAALRGAPRAQVASCGGWPALSELSASARPDGVGAADAAGEYVGQEVLSQLAPERRRALALLAHLGPFDTDLARAVLGEQVDVVGLVAGIPLVTVRSEGEWALHALWRTLLGDEATVAGVAEARRRAGVTLLRRGDAAGAVRHLIDAEAWDELADAVVETLGAGHPPVPHDVLAAWYARLPDDARASPSGRLLEAVVAAELDPHHAAERFEECAADFRAAGHDRGELACLVQLGLLAWWTEEPDHLATLAVRVLQLEAAGCAEATPLACLGRAMLHDIQADSRQSLAELDRIPPGSLSDVWQGLVSWLRSMSLLQLGYASEAIEAVEHALEFTGSMHTPLAEGTRIQALWQEGHTAEVFEAMPVLLQRIRDAGYRHHTALAAAQWSMGLALHGDREGAATCLAQAHAAAVSRGAPLIDSNLAIATAALAVAEGDEASAARVLSDYLDRYPLGQGLSVAPQQRTQALFYVLLPATRERWESADLGPAYHVGRDLARAVSAVRDTGVLPPATPSLGQVSLVQAHLPVPWVAEVGVAAIAAGRDDGWALLDATWTSTRPVVAELAGQGGRDAGLRRAARQALARLAAPPRGRFELRLLGPMELTRDGVLVDAPDWRRERVRSLLAYLALHGTASRSEVGEALWPTLDTEAQSRNLRVTLTYLLRVLEPERGPRDPSFFLRQDDGNLSLHAGDHLSVDVWEFDDRCDRADDADRRGAPSQALDHALRAVELWRGEPTELLSEAAAVTGIETRRLRFANLAVRAGELLLAQGSVEDAHALAERALAVDPWLEAAHRLVVVVHRARGDELAARRALARYREAVRDLGVTPGEATLMVERLVQTTPELSGWG